MLSAGPSASAAAASVGGGAAAASSGGSAVAKHASARLPHALLVGMSFFKEALAREGEEHTAPGTVNSNVRDRVRALALEAIRYIVFTVSTRPAEECEEGKHSCAFFSERGAKTLIDDARRAGTGLLPFTEIYLDYFRFPAAYLETSLVPFLQHVLPMLINEGAVQKGAKIYFVNDNRLMNAAEEAIKRCGKLFMKQVIDPLENPLYAVTALAASQDFNKNILTQEQHYKELSDRTEDGSGSPKFIRLTLENMPEVTSLSDCSEEQRKAAFEHQMARLARQTAAIQHAIKSQGLEEQVTEMFNQHEEAIWKMSCKMVLSEGLHRCGHGGIGVVAVTAMRGSDNANAQQLGAAQGWLCDQKTFEKISAVAAFNTTFRITSDEVLILRPDTFAANINAPTNIQVNGHPVRAQVRFVTSSAEKDRCVRVELLKSGSIQADSEIFISYGVTFFRHVVLCCEVCYFVRAASAMVPCVVCQKAVVHDSCLPDCGPRAASRRWTCTYCSDVRSSSLAVQSAAHVHANTEPAPASSALSSTASAMHQRSGLVSATAKTHTTSALPRALATPLQPTLPQPALRRSALPRQALQLTMTNGGSPIEMLQPMNASAQHESRAQALARTIADILGQLHVITIAGDGNCAVRAFLTARKALSLNILSLSEAQELIATDEEVQETRQHLGEWIKQNWEFLNTPGNFGENGAVGAVFNLENFGRNGMYLRCVSENHAHLQSALNLIHESRRARQESDGKDYLQLVAGAHRADDELKTHYAEEVSTMRFWLTRTCLVALSYMQDTNLVLLADPPNMARQWASPPLVLADYNPLSASRIYAAYNVTNHYSAVIQLAISPAAPVAAAAADVAAPGTPPRALRSGMPAAAATSASSAARPSTKLSQPSATKQPASAPRPSTAAASASLQPSVQAPRAAIASAPHTLNGTSERWAAAAAESKIASNDSWDKSLSDFDSDPVATESDTPDAASDSDVQLLPDRRVRDRPRRRLDFGHDPAATSSANTQPREKLNSAKKGKQQEKRRRKEARRKKNADAVMEAAKKDALTAPSHVKKALEKTRQFALKPLLERKVKAGVTAHISCGLRPAYDKVEKEVLDMLSIEQCYADMARAQHFNHGLRPDDACYLNVPHQVVKRSGSGEITSAHFSRICTIEFLFQKRAQLVRKYYIEHNIKQFGDSFSKWEATTIRSQVEAWMDGAFKQTRIASAVTDVADESKQADAPAGMANPTRTTSCNERVFPFFDLPGVSVCRRCFAAFVCGIIPAKLESSLRWIGRRYEALRAAPAGTVPGKQQRVILPRKKYKAAGAVLQGVHDGGQYNPASTAASGIDVHMPHATVSQWVEDTNQTLGENISRRTFGRALGLLDKLNCAFKPKLSRSKGIAVCGTCLRLDRQIRRAPTSARKESLRLLKRLHLEQAATQRQEHYRKCQRALLNPNVEMTYHIDGMDQAKTKLPHFFRASKDHEKLVQVPVHVLLLACYGGAVGMSVYNNFKNVKKDSNLTVNCLLHNLMIQARALTSRSVDAHGKKTARIPKHFAGISTDPFPAVDRNAEAKQEFDHGAGPAGEYLGELFQSVRNASSKVTAPSAAAVHTPPSTHETVDVPDESLRPLPLRVSDYLKACAEPTSAPIEFDEEMLRQRLHEMFEEKENATSASAVDEDAEFIEDEEEKRHDERFQQACYEVGRDAVDAQNFSPDEVRRVGDILQVPDGMADKLADLMEKKAECTQWPETLNLQFDNCTGDGKNNTVFAFAAYLVKIGLFKRVNVDFMIVGHTHDKADQYFSRVSQYLHTHDATTPGEFAVALRKAHENPCTPLVFWVHQTHGFQDWINGGKTWTHLERTSHAYSFRFRDADDRATDFAEREACAKKWAENYDRNRHESTEADQVKCTLDLVARQLLREGSSLRRTLLDGAWPTFVAVADGGRAGLGVFAEGPIGVGANVTLYGGLRAQDGDALDKRYTLRCGDPPGHVLDATLFSYAWLHAAMTQLRTSPESLHRAFEAEGAKPISERMRIVMDEQVAAEALRSIGLVNVPELCWLLAFGGHGFLLNAPTNKGEQANCSYQDLSSYTVSETNSAAAPSERTCRLKYADQSCTLKMISTKRDIRRGEQLTAHYHNETQRELHKASSKREIDVLFGATALSNEKVQQWLPVMSELPQHEPLPNPLARVSQAACAQDVLEMVAHLHKNGELSDEGAIEWLRWTVHHTLRIAGECQECVRLRSAISAITIRRKKRAGAEEDEQAEKMKERQKNQLERELQAHLRDPVMVKSGAHTLARDLLLTAWPVSRAGVRVQHPLSGKTATVKPSAKSSLAARIHFETQKAEVMGSRPPRRPFGAAAADSSQRAPDSGTNVERASVEKEGEETRALVRPTPAHAVLVAPKADLRKAQQSEAANSEIVIPIRRLADAVGSALEDLPNPDIFFAVLVNDYRYKVLKSTSPFLVCKLAWRQFLADNLGVLSVNVSRLEKDVPVFKYDRQKPSSDEAKRWATWDPGAEAAALTAKAHRKTGNKRVIVSRLCVIMDEVRKWKIVHAAGKAITEVEPWSILCKLPGTAARPPISKSTARLADTAVNAIHTALASTMASQARNPDAWWQKVVRRADSAEAAAGAAGDAASSPIMYESAAVLEQRSVTPNGGDRWERSELAELRALDAAIASASASRTQKADARKSAGVRKKKTGSSKSRKHARKRKNDAEDDADPDEDVPLSQLTSSQQLQRQQQQQRRSTPPRKAKPRSSPPDPATSARLAEEQAAAEKELEEASLRPGIQANASDLAPTPTTPSDNENDKLYGPPSAVDETTTDGSATEALESEVTDNDAPPTASEDEESADAQEDEAAEEEAEEDSDYEDKREDEEESESDAEDPNKEENMASMQAVESRR